MPGPDALTRRRLLAGAGTALVLPAGAGRAPATAARPAPAERGAAATGSSPAGGDPPWGGRFLGNPTHGDTVRPCQLKVGEPVAYVVPAERSGLVTGVLWPVRTAVAARELKGSPGDYSRGDGGVIRLELRAVGPDGLPTATVLGRSRPNNGDGTPWCVAGLRNRPPHELWRLVEPAPVRAGERVAIWLENVREDVTPGGDWVSCNFLELYAPLPFGRGHAGPYYGDAVELMRRRGRDAWQRYGTYPATGGLWELHLDDGVATGNPFGFSTGQHRKTIGGDAVARQGLRAPAGGADAAGVWLRAFPDDTAAGPLQVRLEDEAGSGLAEVEVPLRGTARTLAFAGQPPAGWSFRPFPAPVRLAGGRGYRVRLAAERPGWWAQPQQLAPARDGSRSRNRPDGTFADFSADGGRSWAGGWDRQDQPGRFARDLHLSLALALG